MSSLGQTAKSLFLTLQSVGSSSSSFVIRKLHTSTNTAKNMQWIKTEMITLFLILEVLPSIPGTFFFPHKCLEISAFFPPKKQNRTLLFTLSKSLHGYPNLQPEYLKISPTWRAVRSQLTDLYFHHWISCSGTWDLFSWKLSPGKYFISARNWNGLFLTQRIVRPLSSSFFPPSLPPSLLSVF